MGTISFTTSKDDKEYLSAIVDRYVDLMKKHQPKCKVNRIEVHMDLAACHANGNPMDFKNLSTADDFNLSHDVNGINRHLNRDTGKLENCFVPRFSLRS